MTSFPVVALVIFAVVGIIFALWLRRTSELRDEKLGGEGNNDSDPEMQKGILPIQKNTQRIKKNQKIPFIIGGLVMLSILASSFYEEFGESADGNGFSFAIIMPVLIALFIPMMIANKKKQQKSQKLSEEQQKIFRAVVLLIAAAVIGIIIFTVFNQR